MQRTEATSAEKSFRIKWCSIYGIATGLSCLWMGMEANRIVMEAFENGTDGVGASFGACVMALWFFGFSAYFFVMFAIVNPNRGFSMIPSRIGLGITILSLTVGTFVGIGNVMHILWFTPLFFALLVGIWFIIKFKSLPACGGNPVGGY